MNTDLNFADALLAWYDTDGRKDLPWQQQPTPYHVWLSEIMLQQTQVTTVIGYYLRFINRFPDIQHLAAASQDEVLTYWAGLGYYARARNLHKTAQQVVAHHHGQLPADIDQLIALPGIGRSTAGAIMTLAYHQRYPILDGNVKRVLTRYFAVTGWPGNKAIEQQLWQYAEQLLPKQRIANYIQAQMDLGATLCTRSRPACERCPLQSQCQAFAMGTPTAFPTKKVKTALPQRQTHWLVLENKHGEFLLNQRPEKGIWGGLWSFAETDDPADLANECRNQFQFHITQHQPLPEFQHTFTHYKLTIHPHHLHGCQDESATQSNSGWYRIEEALKLGLPTPVKSFLKSLQ